jgi:ubiquinone/menaquinone biosynthesis C-methylase UbiE
LNDWEELSDWYDAKQGETGDLWHRALIDPTLLRVIGDSRNKNVLDLGCGNGYLSRRLARNNARVTAVDSSARMIENAKKHDQDNSLGITYVHSDAAHLDSIAENSFDVVFANMSLMDIEDAEGTISEVTRVLKQGGRFAASISHPCFDNGSNSSWLIEKGLEGTRIYRRIREYRKPFSENAPWKISDGERKFTASFHRPLSWYARVLKSYGLAITLLEEPEPEKEFLEKEDDSSGFIEVPLHLVIEAIKL